MLVGRTNRRAFVAALGRVVVWPYQGASPEAYDKRIADHTD
jgi:hypothetical protein